LKKLIAFDLDGTLAPSKSPLPDLMSERIDELLDKFQVCVISGGKFEQFEKQLLSNLKSNPQKLSKLHIMPTCGTQYYVFNQETGAWEKVYSEDLTDNEKSSVTNALEKGLDELGLRESKIYGELIEDRGSQITLSVLGQDIVDELGKEGVDKKEAWDPDNKKKEALREFVAPLIPNLEIKVGGLTSLDVTKPGIDKAYGMQKLMDSLSLSKNDILFIGDRLKEGGNDYPVKAFGIDSLEISNWQETAVAIKAILYATK
jgi:HAD superfamily hydrolase (TIGR01484 family)